MIDRAQVLHVARLARLELTDEETERMSHELSAILDHMDTISQLDLDDVEPTAQVVPGDGSLRRDEVVPSLPREVAFANAPDVTDDGFRVPSPGAG